jgi:hypothetical protein
LENENRIVESRPSESNISSAQFDAFIKTQLGDDVIWRFEAALDESIDLDEEEKLLFRLWRLSKTESNPPDLSFYDQQTEDRPRSSTPIKEVSQLLGPVESMVAKRSLSEVEFTKSVGTGNAGGGNAFDGATPSTSSNQRDEIRRVKNSVDEASRVKNSVDEATPSTSSKQTDETGGNTRAKIAEKPSTSSNAPHSSRTSTFKFEGLFWPEVSTKTSQRMKGSEKKQSFLPFAVSSRAWREYHREKAERAEEKEKEKEERKRRRLEKMTKKDESNPRNDKPAKKKKKINKNQTQKENRERKKGDEPPKSKAKEFPECPICQLLVTDFMNSVTCEMCRRTSHVSCLPSFHRSMFPQLEESDWEEDFSYKCHQCWNTC